MWEDGFGIPYHRTLDDERLGFPIVHVDCDWQSPLRYGDSITVSISVDKMGTSSLHLKKTVVRESDGTLCAEARIVRVAVDLDTMESVPIPDTYRELLGRYSA